MFRIKLLPTLSYISINVSALLGRFSQNRSHIYIRTKMLMHFLQDQKKEDKANLYLTIILAQHVATLVQYLTLVPVIDEHEFNADVLAVRLP